MKVLHFYKTYFPDSHGGLEEVIRQISLNTVPHGVESRVLAASPHPSGQPVVRAEAVVIQGKRYIEIASCPIGLDLLIKYQELQDWADILHLHFPWPFADAVYLLARRRKPCVLTYHSDVVRQRYLGRLYAPLRDAFLGQVERIVATSENYLASSTTLQRYRDKVDVVPIGISEASYPTLNETALQRMRKRFGEGFMLFFGVLRYYKGLDVLIDAARGSGVRLVIAGNGPEGARLRERVLRLGLDNVVFAGYLSETEKVAMYQLCRAVVLPSHMRAEAYGVTLVEGAMFGRPLISADIDTGTTYVNRHGETGLVVEPGSADSLRDAMQQLNDDPAAAAAMGRVARAHYARCLNGETMGQRYFQLYQQTLAHANGQRFGCELHEN